MQDPRYARLGRLLAASLVLTAVLPARADTPASGPVFSESSYRKHIEVLSSDEFAGRAPGTPGEMKTIKYIEQQFREAGLEIVVGDSMFPVVQLVKITPQADSALQLAGPEGRQLALRHRDDAVYWTSRAVPESRIEDAEVVFAGYGIVAPEYGWNDYEGLDVRGKLVLALVNDPGYATQDPKLFTGKAMTYYGRWDYKFAEAVRQGAAGLLVIHETGAAGYPWDVPRNGATNPQFDLRFVDPSQRLAIEGWITEDAAARALGLDGQDFAALKKAASQRGFRGKPLGVKASVGVRNDVENVSSHNVLGQVRGSKRPDEAFLYVAHWDHLGTKADAKPGEDAIYNGASDNATGISALIELARAFGATNPKPERSVMFLAVTAEESGLLGSQSFVESPPLPLANIAGGINMDNLYALGRTRDITVIGYGQSELDDYLRRAAARQGRVPVPEPSPEKGFYYRSDHFNLARHGVPMLYTKAGVDSPTKGPDHGKRWLDDYIATRYHKPSDEYSPSWDVSGTLEDLELYYEVGRAVASSSDWPEWREGSEFRAIRERSRTQAAVPEKN
jgi:Zn-dependent M28 family amino/carboxypeptidase